MQDYLTRLRVEAAMQMLKNTDLSPTSIAYECGFSDPKYMNQGFRKLLGVPPSQWRSETQLHTKAKFRGIEENTQRIFTETEAKAYLLSI